MVIMIVTEQYNVDVWKIVKPDAGRPHALGTRPGERTGTFTIDRVCENIQSLCLYEKTTVIDKSYSVRRMNTRFWFLAKRFFRKRSPPGALSREKPFENIG